MNKKAFYSQDIYMGRWVDREYFRTFVFSAPDALKGTQKKLAKSWDEYQSLIASGLWFDEQPVADKKHKRAQIDVSANS